VHAALQGHGKVPGLLSGPRGGGVGGDAGEVEAPGSVFDEDQGMEALEGDGVNAEEVGRDDAVGLGSEELVPGRPRASWGGVDASGVKDLPDRGRGNRIAQAGQFALYPPVTPTAVLPSQAQDELLDDGRGEGSAWAAALGERPSTGQELTVPTLRWGDREDLVPALPRDQPGKRGEPDAVGRLVPNPGNLTAQHHVLMPQRQHLRVLGHAAARNGSGHRDQIPDQRSDDRQRHPQIVPERSKPRHQDQQTSRPQPESYFRAGQASTRSSPPSAPAWCPSCRVSPG
jgi:hypothetical protein